MKTRTSAQRYNARLHNIFDNARKHEEEIKKLPLEYAGGTIGNAARGPVAMLTRGSWGYDDATGKLLAAAPELAEMLDCLVDDLTEAHADELNSDHHGDGAEGCSYCRNIAKAQALLAKATTPGV